MICLKIRTFVVSATTHIHWIVKLSCCDLLENSYLCGISNNSAWKWLYFCAVVICLKIRTFVVSATTEIQPYCNIFLLWFAWKFVPLWYQQQLLLEMLLPRMCCDLLENSYLCGISNNFASFYYLREWVVICLKIRTFVVSATTGSNRQPEYLGCDLLENSYLCGISNNLIRNAQGQSKLWFAWKFVPLWYQQQPNVGAGMTPLRCDLLENSYLCGISNNNISS